MDAAARPLPSEDTTPPVTKMYLVCRPSISPSTGSRRREQAAHLFKIRGRIDAERVVLRFDGLDANAVFERTKGSGAEVIKKKGGAGFAVGVSIADVVHAIALDQRRIMPVSSLQSGPYGLRDVAISVPTVVGRKGVLGVIEVDLWPKEKMALQKSGSVLRETIEKVL